MDSQAGQSDMTDIVMWKVEGGPSTWDYAKACIEPHPVTNDPEKLLKDPALLQFTLNTGVVGREGIFKIPVLGQLSASRRYGELGEFLDLGITLRMINGMVVDEQHEIPIRKYSLQTRVAAGQIVLPRHLWLASSMTFCSGDVVVVDRSGLFTIAVVVDTRPNAKYGMISIADLHLKHYYEDGSLAKISAPPSKLRYASVNEVVGAIDEWLISQSIQSFPHSMRVVQKGDIERVTIQVLLS